MLCGHMGVQRKNSAGMGCGGPKMHSGPKMVDATLDQKSCSSSWSVTGQIRPCVLCESLIVMVY